MSDVPASNTSGAIDLQIASGRLRIDVLSDSIVRVRFTLDAEFENRPSYMVLPQTLARASTWSIDESESTLTLSTARLALRIDRATGAFIWFDANGQLLVREPARGGKSLERVNVERRIFDPNIVIKTESTVDGMKARVEGAKVVIDRQAFQTKQEFIFSKGEAIYGLGQHEDGILNYRGKCQHLYQQNMKVAMPVIVSTRGWGILFDSASLCEFHDDEHGSYFWSEVDDELDYYFIVGPEFDQIVAGLRQLTGKPTMLPRWAFGYVQSKERYRTQQELIDTVAEFRKRQIPLDCIVQDWLTWTGKWWGDKNPDKDRYADPTALVESLHAMNAKLMVSIWPLMRGESPNQVEMRKAGFLLGNDATYNAFNPAARELYWQQANRGWFRHGIDAWWCDCTEPFEADWKGSIKPQPWKRVQINTNESKTYLDPERINAYSMLHSQGIYEHQRATREDKRVVNLTRSGFPGQQRYGAITWSGDTAARWETYRRQIADGLNFCVTGNPRWTIDIGAFFVGQKEQWFWRGDYPKGCDDEGYRELYVRWMQFGAFLPMMRSHGTDTPREPWRFGEPGEPAYDAMLKCIQLRYRLLPYIYSVAAAETLRDDTMFRMLAFDFRHDPKVYNIKDQFMFGGSLMICPVMQPMYFGPNSTPIADAPKTREVYLPSGSDWCDFWTGQRFTGGQAVTASASLDTLPIFVRAGSIVPMGPDVQHSGERLDAPIELRIHSGRDGRFDLYDDAGDGYGYERGEHSITLLCWSDASRTLAIGPRVGSYPGMLASRVFDVIVDGAAPERVVVRNRAVLVSV
ncbi:MAG: glycoside hydrolase family 31 protein [Tepidisphaeraceae bacterium]